MNKIKLNNESEKYICKIGTVHDVIKIYNNKIKNYEWKNINYKKLFKENNSVAYFIEKDGIIIGKAFAAINKNACNDSDKLIDNNTAYLYSFEIKKEYRGRKIFSKLYWFMENDLKNRGYTKLTLGVEDNSDGNNNLKIYNHLGYNTFVKNGIEIELFNPNKTTYKVNYYSKNIK